MWVQLRFVWAQKSWPVRSLFVVLFFMAGLGFQSPLLFVSWPYTLYLDSPLAVCPCQPMQGCPLRSVCGCSFRSFQYPRPPLCQYLSFSPATTALRDGLYPRGHYWWILFLYLPVVKQCSRSSSTSMYPLPDLDQCLLWSRLLYSTTYRRL